MEDFAKRFIKKTFSRDAVLVSFLVFLGCVVSGPFGTYIAIDFGERIFFWGVLIFLALCVGGLCCETLWRWMSDKSALLRSVATSLAFSVVYTPVLVWIGQASLLIDPSIRRSPHEVFLLVFGFALILCGYILFADAKRRPATNARPRLLDRLPETCGGRVIRLTVKDHYVHVYLDDGLEHRILIRFADAVNEMAGEPGFCTHRSHWVAKAATKRAVRRQNKEFVVLTNGAEVPISKTYRPNVVAAGLL